MRYDLSMGAFTDYFEAAMRLAEFEEMEEDEGWFGTIPGFDGLWASGQTLELCRVELRSTLEDWVLFSINHRMPLPAAGGIDLHLAPIEAA